MRAHQLSLDGFIDVPRAPPKRKKPRELARANDPATSKLAAHDIQQHLGELQRLALDAVAMWPRCTSTELARHLNRGDPRVLNRRLPELREAGLVRDGPARKCSVTGRMATTWEIVASRLEF